MKLEQLEQTVLRLQREIATLAQENQALRQSRSSVLTDDIPARKRSRSTQENSSSQNNISLLPASQSQPSDHPEAQKFSTLFQPCTHNCGSALGDAMEDFAFDIFDALDNFEDFDSIEDEATVFGDDSDLPA